MPVAKRGEVGEKGCGGEIARGIEEDDGIAVGRRGKGRAASCNPAVRTPGKGTDRYWGKLGWRWRGLFIFRGGAAAGVVGREVVAGTNGRPEVEGKFAVLRSGLRDAGREKKREYVLVCVCVCVCLCERERERRRRSGE